MHKVGIDNIAFATSRSYIDMATLAKARNIDPDKYYHGLGVLKMGVASPNEDIITLACEAADPLITAEESDRIELLLFATESGIDQSKAAGIYCHSLLNLSSQCRVIELKQACYSATAGLQMAMTWLQQHPDKKALVIASDIARYGLQTPGESTQGCGAVAILLSVNPRLVEIEPENSYYTKDVMDFWRPNYRDEAFVDGKASSRLYLNLLEQTWLDYSKKSQRHYSNHDYFCYHIPVPSLVERAHKHLMKISHVASDFSPSVLRHQVSDSLHYSRQIGNCYSASLYLGLCSLLDNATTDLAGKRVGFYSYGSGCVAEYFSGVITDAYQSTLNKHIHKRRLSQRTELNYEEYVTNYQFTLPTDGSEYRTPRSDTNHYHLVGIKEHKRLYECTH